MLCLSGISVLYCHSNENLTQNVLVCRQVKLAEPTTTSYGGLTTCTNYHLIKKQESVVDSVFVHDNYTRSPGANDNSMVVVTKHQVWSLADDDED